MIQDVVGPVATPVEKPEVALLIDGENISQDFAGKILMRSLTFGSLNIRRVYGNVGKLGKWETAPGFRLVHSGTGKNATDLLLTVEAMDLVLRCGVKTIVLASSDRDFTHLAHYLREAGVKVIGMGETKAPEAFRKACSMFYEVAQADTPVVSKEGPDNILNLNKEISVMIEKSGGSDGILLTTLGLEMHKTHQFKISCLPQRTWRRYLTEHPEIFECDPKGPNAKVRLKS
jgi:hypothetical protein